MLCSPTKTPTVAHEDVVTTVEIDNPARERNLEKLNTTSISPPWRTLNAAAPQRFVCPTPVERLNLGQRRCNGLAAIMQVAAVIELTLCPFSLAASNG